MSSIRTSGTFAEKATGLPKVGSLCLIPGRKLALEWQVWINVAGMIALLALMALITVYDVVRIF